MTDEVSLKGRKAGFSIRPREVWKHMRQQGVFSDKEKVILSELADYLSYENAIADKNGPMNLAAMADELGYDLSNFSKVFRGLMKKNALGCFDSGTNKTYYMNPDLYCRGGRKPWLEQQFSHKATMSSREGAHTVYAGKKRTAVVKWETMRKISK